MPTSTCSAIYQALLVFAFIGLTAMSDVAEQLPEYKSAAPRGSLSTTCELVLDACSTGTRYTPGETLVLRARRLQASVHALKCGLCRLARSLTASIKLRATIDSRPFEDLPQYHDFICNPYMERFETDELVLRIELPRATCCAVCGSGPFPLPTSLYLAEKKSGVCRSWRELD